MITKPISPLFGVGVEFYGTQLKIWRQSRKRISAAVTWIKCKRNEMTCHKCRIWKRPQSQIKPQFFHLRSDLQKSDLLILDCGEPTLLKKYSFLAPCKNIWLVGGDLAPSLEILISSTVRSEEEVIFSALINLESIWHCQIRLEPFKICRSPWPFIKGYQLSENKFGKYPTDIVAILFRNSLSKVDQHTYSGAKDWNSKSALRTICDKHSFSSVLSLFYPIFFCESRSLC